MSAIPEEFLKKTAQVSEEIVRPFANSKKIYVTGSRPDIRVPMRQINQSPTQSDSGMEINPPIYVYDTSGPYSDPAVKINLLAGMPEVRSAWIA
ncbi:MAG: phosphomethylpyrimidine synthase ThiC, partial [Pseudomonadota bacterium]|nr:phosphomethylpyrimidine synthase ThiC [Pseudomonadota bacterium]